MWLATVRGNFSNSTGGTILLGINYGDVGHVTTSTNHITVFVRTLVSNRAILVRFCCSTEIKCNCVAMGTWLTTWCNWYYNVVTLLASYE